MKKRLCFGLALVPVVLMGVMLWVRKTAWEHLEADFQHDVSADTSRSFSLEGVQKKRSQIRFSRSAMLTHAELQALLANVHLRKSTQDGGEDTAKYLQVVGSCGALRMTSHPLQVEIESRFDLDFDTSKYGKSIFVLSYLSSCKCAWGEKWSGYELTPESARVLRDAIFAKYSHQIKAFRTRTK